MRAFDFVRRIGISPVFIDVTDLPLTAPAKKKATLKPTARPKAKIKRSFNQQKPPLEAQKPIKPKECQAQAYLPKPEQEASPTPDPQPAPATPEPRYVLTLESWPLQAGLRFLVEAFCDEHGEEYRKLYSAFQADELSTNDLIQLAETLLKLCGDEPDFSQRGALMKRVRLALLKASEHSLNLSQLTQETGLSPKGLQGRIKDKAGDWLQILPPESPNPS